MPTRNSKEMIFNDNERKIDDCCIWDFDLRVYWCKYVHLLHNRSGRSDLRLCTWSISLHRNWRNYLLLQQWQAGKGEQNLDDFKKRTLTALVLTRATLSNLYRTHLRNFCLHRITKIFLRCMESTY